MPKDVSYTVSQVEFMSEPCKEPYKFISIKSKEIDGRFYEILFHLSKEDDRVNMDVYFQNQDDMVFTPIGFSFECDEFNDLGYDLTIPSIFKELMKDILFEFSDCDEYPEMFYEFKFKAPKVFCDVFKNMKKYPCIVEYIESEKNHEYECDFSETDMCGRLGGIERFEL